MTELKLITNKVFAQLIKDNNNIFLDLYKRFFCHTLTEDYLFDKIRIIFKEYIYQPGITPSAQSMMLLECSVNLLNALNDFNQYVEEVESQNNSKETIQ